jgi:hypothetical protein
VHESSITWDQLKYNYFKEIHVDIFILPRHFGSTYKLDLNQSMFGFLLAGSIL